MKTKYNTIVIQWLLLRLNRIEISATPEFLDGNHLHKFYADKEELIFDKIDLYHKNLRL